MSTDPRAAREARFTSDLRARILDLGVPDPEVRDVVVGRTVTVLDEDAWRIQLRLVYPIGGEWDADALFELRRRVRAVAEELIDEHDMPLPGVPLIEISTVEAPDDETAPDDVPTAEEDPDARPSAEDEAAR